MSRALSKKTTTAREPAEVAKGQARSALPTIRAWVAEVLLDREGNEAEIPASAALHVFGVSVHEQYPANEEARLDLMRLVGTSFRPRHDAPAPTSLWVFPGGYFGFDAAAYAAKTGGAWTGFDAEVVRQELPRVLAFFPPNARLAFGADSLRGEEEIDQQVWVCWIETGGSFREKVVIRGVSDLSDRTLEIGGIGAAFFVCGEFTGSASKANGEFCPGKLLDDPLRQLAEYRLLVDVAHSRVRGTVYGEPSRRLVHERQLRRFASVGAAVLTHHHSGDQRDGRARHDCQSNWVVTRGGKWLDESRVIAVH